MPVVYAGEPPGRFEGGGVGCQSENSPPRQYGRQQAGAQAGMGHRCGAPGLRNLFQQEVDACDEAPSREEECEASGEEVAPDEFGAFGRIGIRGDAHERRRDEGTEEDEQKAFGHRNGIGERVGCRFVPAAGFAAEYAERQRRRIGIGDVSPSISQCVASMRNRSLVSWGHTKVSSMKQKKTGSRRTGTAIRETIRSAACRYGVGFMASYVAENDCKDSIFCGISVAALRLFRRMRGGCRSTGRTRFFRRIGTKRAIFCYICKKLNSKRHYGKDKRNDCR